MLFALVSLLGCRDGDTSVCEVSEARTCSRADELELGRLLFARARYDSCSEAVGNTTCGIEAEHLRRCLDRRAEPLCVSVHYWETSSEQLVASSGCADLMHDFRHCEDGKDR